MICSTHPSSYTHSPPSSSVEVAYPGAWGIPSQTLVDEKAHTAMCPRLRHQLALQAGEEYPSSGFSHSGDQDTQWEPQFAPQIPSWVTKETSQKAKSSCPKMSTVALFL